MILRIALVALVVSAGFGGVQYWRASMLSAELAAAERAVAAAEAARRFEQKARAAAIEEAARQRAAALKFRSIAERIVDAADSHDPASRLLLDTARDLGLRPEND